MSIADEIRGYYDNNPIDNFIGSKEEYYRAVASIIGTSPSHVKKTILRHNQGLKLTKVKVSPSGEETQTYSLRGNDKINQDGMVLVGATTNPHGSDWKRFINPDFNIEQFKKDFVEEMKAYAPSYTPIVRVTYDDPCVLILPQADVHIGKYSNDYDLRTAVDRCLEGTRKLLSKAKHQNIEKIIYVSGNDKQHTANGKTSTKFTPQDTQGLWHEHFKIAQELDIKSIEMMLDLADVHYVHVMSNHDYQNGYMLAQVIQAWFNNNQNVTFDVSPEHRKYVKYGANLIGLSHGDGAKASELPDLMKVEAKQAWAKAKFGYWYLGHLHHKIRETYRGKRKRNIEKDYRDVMVIENGYESKPEDQMYVEYLRTISGSDEWHKTKGFTGSPICMEAFIHDAKYGQTDRLSVYF